MIPTRQFLEALAERRITTDSGLTVQPILVSVREAAAMMNLSETYLYRKLITPGRLPSFNEGRRRMIRVAAIEEYCKAQEESQRPASLPDFSVARRRRRRAV